jgi:LysM repeat protein
MKSGSKTTLVALFLALSLATGCSSQQGGDSEPMLLDPGMESGADTVGSIPEDSLNKEEQPMDAMAASGSEGYHDLANATSSEPSADPFADLNGGETAGSATEVASGDQTTDSAPFADVVADSSHPAAATGSGGTAEYVVKPGDTLMKIAFSIYGDIDRWKDLRDWNSGKVKHFSKLKTGTKLTYEAPVVAFSAEEHSHSYLIKHGDTLANIADDVYGRRSKYKKLASFNKNLIKNVNRIFAGFTLFYEITPKEMAEAEARRQQKAAGGIHLGEASSIPSAVSPSMDLTQGPSAPLAVSPVPAPASTTH